MKASYEEAPAPQPSPEPKSDISDFGQLQMPNSGKPEFGRERELTEPWHE